MPFRWLAVLALASCSSDPVALSPPMDGSTSDDASVLPLTSPADVVTVDRTAANDEGSRSDDAGASDAPPSDAGPMEEASVVAADVPAPPMDTGADVPAPPMDTGTDVPAPPMDTGTDVPAPPMDTGADVVVPRDLGPPPVDAGPVPAVTGVPRIDAALKSAMRTVYLRGLAAGHRAGVFAKIGDSITESASFLSDFGPASGTPSWNLGAFTAFDPTLAFFNATLVDEAHSSFDRPSLAATTGWTSARALEDDAMLVRQELAALRPSVALVMLGSAEVDVTDIAAYRLNLTRIVQLVLATNIIPVLSTIPDRFDSPTTTMLCPLFVAAIRDVAAAQHVPLQDYWTALQPLPNRGLSDDGVHPSIYHQPGGNVEAAYFTAPALAYGYNVRNLQTLATLAHVRAVIFEDGPADR